MANSLPDQAEGLRRLFITDVRRMVALLSATENPADRRIVASLAATLAEQGRKVLLLDESSSAEDAPAHYGLPLKHDLNTLLLSGVEIEAAIARTASGVDLLAGGNQVRHLPRPKMEARMALINAFYRLAGKYDVVLVNASADAVGSRPSFAWACQDVIVVCGDQPDAVTESYARIKLLHQAGERRFHLLFRAQDDLRAQTFYRNIAAVSRRHLQLLPEYLGVLPAPADGEPDFYTKLAQAVQSWPMPEHKAGHFPDLMRRLLRGAHSQALPAALK